MSRSCRTLFVGNLPGDIREREVEDLFYKYGSVVHIDLKVPLTPPGFAFVEFADARGAEDAEDAIRGRDGYKLDGHRLRVELAHGGRGNSSSTDRHNSGSPGPRGRVSRHLEYRVLITGLPQSASCQDLKDHMRRAGDVSFSRVFHKGSGKTGIVDYTNSDDMRNAIKKLDDSEFRNAFSRSRIHVKEYDSSRTRSRRQRRSRSRSPFYSKGRSNVEKEGDQSDHFVVDAVGDQSDRTETSYVTLRDGTTCTFTVCISKHDHCIARARPKEKLSDDYLAKRRALLEQMKKFYGDWPFVPDVMRNEGA